MMRSFVYGVVVLASLAFTGCDSSEGDGGTGGAGSGSGGSGGTGGAVAATTADTGTGGEDGGLADECPERNVTEPCEGGGMRGCGEAADGSGRLVWTECDESSGAGSTPLVLSFDGSDASFAAGASAAFDVTGLGQSIATDWPSARTPWLALDRDGSGAIEDGAELFGSAVAVARGGLAQHGFEALAELDANGDGVLDAADPRFGELLLWSDASGDRRSQLGELTTLGARSIVSISLAFSRTRTCDARGNCGIERAAFTWLDAHGAPHQGRVIDVHLAFQQD